jgi:hypothetical protein
LVVAAPACLSRDVLLEHVSADRDIFWLRSTRIEALPGPDEYAWIETLCQLAKEGRDCGKICGAKYRWLAEVYELCNSGAFPPIGDSTKRLLEIIKILESSEFDLRDCVVTLPSNKDCFVLTLAQSNVAIDLAESISITEIFKDVVPRFPLWRARRTERELFALVDGLSMRPAAPDRHLVSSVFW